MSGSSDFIWIGTTDEAWNTPSNWQDVTTGQTPAVIVPGSLDNVVVSNGTLTGSGSTASLTFTGADSVLGELNAGTLVVAPGSDSAFAEVDIGEGATISAVTAASAGTISVSGSAAALLVSGMLQIGASSTGGQVSATDGGLMQADNLVFGADSSNRVAVDSLSTMEIGNVGAAAVGCLTIDPNHALIGPGSLVGNTVDNGLISSDELTLGEPVIFAGGVGSSSFQSATFTSLLSGAGTVEVVPSGTVTLQEPVTSEGLTFQLNGTADLSIEASIAAGNTIELSGNSNTLTIDDQWYLEKHPAQAPGQNPFFTGTSPIVDAAINGFNNSDTLNFVDDFQLGTTITSLAYTGGILTLTSSGTINSTFSLVGDYSSQNFSIGPATSSSFPGETQQAITVACYAAGTRLQTTDGDRAVEDLREGDLVVVSRGGSNCKERVKWVGNQRIRLQDHPQRILAAPIHIRSNAFGQLQPHRDLYVSPDHCIYVDGRLIPALMLVNDMTIVQEIDHEYITYFHIELDQHGLLIAEGLLAESYLDTGNRAMFVNAGTALLLHPEFQVNHSLRTWRDHACAPLAVDPATLEPIWIRLANRAEQLGYRPRVITTSADPHLQAIVAGRPIRPVYNSGKLLVFILPPLTARVILASRATRPADIVRYVDDRRLLGVAVRDVILRVGEVAQKFAADYLPAGDGWHAFERTSDAFWRWTDGAGELHFCPTTQVAILEVRLSGETRYIVEDTPAEMVLLESSHQSLNPTAGWMTTFGQAASNGLNTVAVQKEVESAVKLGERGGGGDEGNYATHRSPDRTGQLIVDT